MRLDNFLAHRYLWQFINSRGPKVLPTQDEINEMSAHRGTTCYDKMPDYIKDKPAITEVYSGTTYDIAYENNQEYLGKVGASQEPGKRIYGAQDD